MEYMEQPSIDSVLCSPIADLASVRSAMDMHFQNTDYRVKRKSYMYSPTTPSTPSIYDALGSHPPSLSMMTAHGLKQKPQTTLLVIPDSGRLSVNGPSQIAFSGAHAHHFDESALYTPTETSPSLSPILPSPSSPTSPPSLSHTPTTPPTPHSPLLPCFPEVSVSIYKNIPFSPTLPSFPDCPFKYYHEHIPISKSRAQSRPSMETYVTAPSSPISPIGVMISDSPITSMIEEMTTVDRGYFCQPKTQLETSIFDFDSDIDEEEDDDDDAGSYDDEEEGYQEQVYNDMRRTRSSTATSVQTQFKYPQLDLSTLLQTMKPHASPTTSSPTSPSVSASAVEQVLPFSWISTTTSISPTSSSSPYSISSTSTSTSEQIRRQQKQLSLDAQLRDLERIYAALKRQKELGAGFSSSSLSYSTATTTTTTATSITSEQNPLRIKGGLRLSVP